VARWPTEPRLVVPRQIARWKVTILDDYFDMLRTLPSFARLTGHQVEVWMTRDEYEVQFADVFDQIVAYAEGRPINVVNPAVLERG
jgi:hypothetical protein